MSKVTFVRYGGPAMPGHLMARVEIANRDLLYSLSPPRRLIQMDEHPVGRLLDRRARLLIRWALMRKP